MKKRYYPSNSPTKLKAAPKTQPLTKQRRDGYINKIVPKAISQIRNDIATWKSALKQAQSIVYPKRIRLHNIYYDVAMDALLTSQIENRILKTLGADFVLKDKEGNVDEESTALLKSSKIYYDFVRAILDSIFRGSTVVELTSDKNGLTLSMIPHKNIIPETGTLLIDETDVNGIDYRNIREFNVWLYEFGEPKDYGLMNKAIPHVLFKRFAQSCWSELCEIYGIPPRVMKTNTQDPAMLARGEQMMRDMGAAAFFIIDDSESFEWAKSVDTNGDVYGNLIRLCYNEISLLICGAIIGQDTKNGNESKETISIGMFQDKINSDKMLVESHFNRNILNGLYLIGFLPEGLTFQFTPQEDITKLWGMTKDAMAFFNIDPDWIKDKFGIAVLSPKVNQIPAQLSSFFA